MANLITLGRIFLVVPFTALFFVSAEWAIKAAFVVFIIAAFTDFLDGWVARKQGTTSTLGAALDPLADKLLVAATMVLLIRNGVIHGAGVTAVLIIILREFLVTGLREAIALRGETLPVTALAKWKTTAQLVAGGLFLLAAPTGWIGEAAAPAAVGCLWLAAVLTFWTGADYAMRAIRQLRSD